MRVDSEMVRLVIQAILGFACALLAITVWARPDGILGVGVFLIGFLLLIILVLGRWWPGARKRKDDPVDLATEPVISIGPVKLKVLAPLSAYPTLLLIVSVLPFYSAWDVYSHPRETYRQLFKTIYESFGNEGVVVANLVMGLALVVAAMLVYRRMKIFYKT